MASFTLDDIRKAADAEFANTEITLDDGFKVTLVNVLQLSKDKRDAFTKATESVKDEEGNESDKDGLVVLQNALRCVADTEEGGNRLLNQVGDNLAQLSTILKLYSGKTELGEA